MKLRHPLAALLGFGLLAAALGVVVSAPTAEGRVMRLPTIERAAEWGVWKVRAGHVISLDELAAELPDFVHRGRPSAPPRHVPSRNRYRAEKPVLYLYASEATSVRVRVRLPVGGGTLHYPGATRSRGGLLFSGRLLSTSVSAISSPGLQPAPRGHFWNAMRRVPASFFISDAGETERFIFYDGLTDLTGPFTFRGAGEPSSVSPRRGHRAQPSIPDIIYVVHGGMFRRVVVAPGARSRTSIASADEQPISALVRELRSQLMARGLTTLEAQSLLTTWHHDLVEDSGDRRIYFLDRADYDRMLPLTIRPAPSQIVRVGLVIELP